LIFEFNNQQSSSLQPIIWTAAAPEPFT